MNVSPKVGIVVVCHNASQAVRITLASLRQVKNETPAKLIVVDNASYEIERKKIRSAFDRHAQNASLPWEYIQQNQNLGFAGGNNTGIKRLLDDPDISHICLLNSDVIVTDYWLDRLLQTQCDIVSTVTNKAESEQCIPIDYAITMDECLDEQTEEIKTFPLSQVNKFAQEWNRAWTGNTVEGEATFFCVLIARQVFETVGLLDETFFPGGYEDDDFCIRARQHGYHVNIARDIFTHHWGSASFGQLQFEYFSENASRNLRYLENKHQISRRRRAEKPFASFLADVRFAARDNREPALRQKYHELSTEQLSALLKHFESEFKGLYQMTLNTGREIPPALQTQIKESGRFEDLTTLWGQIVVATRSIFLGSDKGVDLTKVFADLDYLIEGISTRVECNFAMHAFVYTPPTSQVKQETYGTPKRTSASVLRQLGMLLHSLKRGISLLRELQGVVFFGGYPYYAERQSDGYFQRIQMVDQLFTDQWRIYIEGGYLPGRNHWRDRPEPKVLVFRSTGRRYQRLMAQVFALIAILKCGKVYFHSILSMQHKYISWLLSLPGLTKVIDVHGVVTEEFRLHNDFYNAMSYEPVERLAIRKCDVVVVVTRAMENYLRQKYRHELKGRVVLFPMFPNYSLATETRPYIDGKPVIVYAGGLQKWQQVSKMVDAITSTHDRYQYQFYCPEPSKMQEMLPEQIFPDVVIERKSREELLDLYPKCHYGFILREDNIVNHAACPTKLVEYLAMGIVPIINTENIGDFHAMGMQAITLDTLLRHSLPDETERAKMAQVNFELYQCLHEIYEEGAQQVRAMLDDKSNIREPRSAFQRLKDLFPLNTRRGLILRTFWMKVRAAVLRLTGRKKDTEPTIVPDLPTCDILVQVDNFEAGGLENIALDVNDALLHAGYKVVLLVLGSVGAAVEQARQRGMTVLIGSADREWYRKALEQIQPRLLLSHYSTFGVEICHELDIPVVHVIQNAYMWFDQKQRAEFKKAADLTTAFISLSEYAKHYSVYRLGIDKDRCIVLPSGIDSEAFNETYMDKARRELRFRYGFTDQDFIFLSVGAINHQKNHIATVRAFAEQASNIPSAKLLILGPAYEKNLLTEILHFIEKRKLTDRIIYAGSAAGAQGHYALADAFISAAFFEGGQLNLTEAVRANLPIVTANIGLARHFIGLPGIEVIEPAVDINEFQGAIWQLSSTAEFEKRLSDAIVKVYKNPKRPNLPQEILQAFDKSHTYGLFVKLIEDLIEGHGINKDIYRSTWVSLVEGLPRE